MHSQVPTIVKINGDYLDCEFRNTADELKDYPNEMRNSSVAFLRILV